MKILVTGGAGFLGQEIIAQLQASGHEVVSLQRTHSGVLAAKGIKQYLVDLSDEKKLREKVIEHFDAIIHTAAKAGIWGSYASYHLPNVAATQNIINLALAKKIRYLVYTSSPSTVYGKEPIENANETLAYPKQYLAHYGRTKAEAERLVLAAHGGELQTIALRPHLIWGPGDQHILPRLVARAKAGRLMQVGEGHNLVDVIHVQNAAHAHLCALGFLQENAANGGKTYFVSQERPVPLWWFIPKLLATQGLDVELKKIPLEVAYAIGSVLEAGYHLMPWLKGEPPMTRFLALQMGTSHYFNQSMAITELSYRPKITLEDGLKTLSVV